jgi:hypothetical protein
MHIICDSESLARDRQTQAILSRSRHGEEALHREQSLAQVHASLGRVSRINPLWAVYEYPFTDELDFRTESGARDTPSGLKLQVVNHRGLGLSGRNEPGVFHTLGSARMRRSPHFSRVGYSAILRDG